MKTQIKVSLWLRPDDDGDNSCLGQYGSKKNNLGRFVIDRKTGNMYDTERTVMAADDDGDIVESWPIVANVGSTYGRNDYQYLGGFQHTGSRASWGNQIKPDDIRKYLQVARNDGKFRKYDIKPHFGGKDRLDSAYWLDVLYCAQDASRLEDYGNGWWYNWLKISIECNGQEIGNGSLGGIESDCGPADVAEIVRETASEAFREAADSLDTDEEKAQLAAILAMIEASKDFDFDGNGKLQYVKTWQPGSLSNGLPDGSPADDADDDPDDADDSE